MFELNPQSVANWLINEDGSGASDEEFLATINLMKEKIDDNLSDDYTFINWLEDVIYEIENG